MATVETQSEILTCDDASYHGDYSAVSNTTLGWFINSPELYHGIVSGRFPAPTFEAAALGSAVHSVLLEGKAIADVAVLIPRDVLSANGSRAGSAWKAFEAENAGKLLLKAGEFTEIETIVNAVRSDAMAARMLAMPGPTEQAIRWTCKVSGLKRRAKLDKRADKFVADIKTTSDISPKGFAKSAWTFGYARQAAFYQDAAEALTGERPDVVFIAVEKAAPYRCQCYELDGDFLTMGRDVMEYSLEDLAARIEMDNWTSPSAGKVLTVSAPAWAKYESDWSAA